MNDTTGIITSNIATKQIDLSVLGMIMGADIIVQFVLLILAIASVWSWAVIIDKSILLRNIGKKINEFESIFWSGQLLDKLYDRVRHQPDNPMAVVFVSAMDEWNKQSHMESRNQNAYSYLRVSLKNRIMQAMDNSKNKELEKLFKNLSFLAVVGSSATFIGVFGTVWGIMSSLKSIALAQNASLSVVAPGISEALFATAVGLAAAVPATIFYNILSSRINSIDSKVEDFSSELNSLLSQEIDRGMDNDNSAN